MYRQYQKCNRNYINLTLTTNSTTTSSKQNKESKYTMIEKKQIYITNTNTNTFIVT